MSPKDPSATEPPRNSVHVVGESMGNATASPEDSKESQDDDMQVDDHSTQIKSLLRYARSHHQTNPTEALAALMQAMTLQTGNADAARQRLRQELGEDMANHVLTATSASDRHRAARVAVQSLLQDETTFLHQQGRQDLLRQTMEDGSSVVCRVCGDVVASARWEQHQAYWCRATADDDDEMESD